VGTVANEFVEFLEAAFIKEQVNAFAGAELALLVFAFATFRAAAGFGFGVEPAKLFEAVVMLAMGGQERGSRAMRFGDGTRESLIAIHGLMLRLEDVSGLCFEQVMAIFGCGRVAIRNCGVCWSMP